MLLCSTLNQSSRSRGLDSYGAAHINIDEKASTRLADAANVRKPPETRSNSISMRAEPNMLTMP